MTNQWHYAKQGQRIGPVSEEHFKSLALSGEIQPTDMVWTEGMSQWMEAKNIEGLFPYVNPRLSPPLPTNPTTQSSYIQNQGDQSLIHPSNSPHNPVFMGILSGCCIAGLGQVILGQKIKGLVILLGSMVLAVLTGGISIFVTWPAGGIDAYLIAKKLKEGKSVGQWEFF